MILALLTLIVPVPLGSNTISPSVLVLLTVLPLIRMLLTSTCVSPASVVELEPRLMSVVPTVTLLLDKAVFGIAVKPVPILPLVNVPTVTILLDPAAGAAPTEL